MLVSHFIQYNQTQEVASAESKNKKNKISTVYSQSRRKEDHKESQHK